LEALYITMKEYEDYWDINADEDNFQKNLILSKEKVDTITHNRIVAIGFENLTKFQKEKIKLAMFHQIAFLEENGTESSDVSGYSVLDISVNVDKTTQTKAQKLHISSFALDQLQKTGLCTNSFRWH